ncbi:MAG: hypothetical protein QOJ57_1034, partial [Thermoleophilaceae bacterium]|nr:hypothetical protein [Thermoleophilaceae bacterium]
WSAFRPCAFGQMKPRLKTSSSSPLIFTTCPSLVSIASPQVASQSGQVRKCVSATAAMEGA